MFKYTSLALFVLYIGTVNGQTATKTSSTPNLLNTSPIISMMGTTNEVQFFSYVTKYIQGESSRVAYRVDSSGKRIGVRMANLPLMTLLAQVYYNKLRTDNPNMFIIESRRKAEISLPNKSQFSSDEAYKQALSSNLWCYDLKIPREMSDSLSGIMQEDFKRYFNLIGIVEKRKVKCLALVQVSSLEKLKAAHPEKKGTISFGKQGGAEIRNGGMNTLVYYINNFKKSLKNIPVVDATNYTGSIDIDFKANFADLPAVIKELQRHGLDLVEREMETDMVVIKDFK